MTPLFRAVYHACRAGAHQRALADIYRTRILRGDEYYLLFNLGGFGTNLSLLVNFFETPWTQPVPSLSPAEQSWVTARVGYTLRAIGRLSEAIDPTRVAAQADADLKDWRNAAISYRNLSELHLALGSVSESVAAARQAVAFADLSGDLVERIVNRSSLGDALHQSGDFDEAMLFFDQAERLQAEREPDYPMLYSLEGFQYCDLLLSCGHPAGVLERAAQTLSWCEAHYPLLFPIASTTFRSAAPAPAVRKKPRSTSTQPRITCAVRECSNICPVP
jgi:tetratricopeptide (TPR) repeat protein